METKSRLETMKSGTNPFIDVDSNVYENLRHLSGPCLDESLTKDYYNPENIYENICHDCGRIYDDICGFCNDDEPISHKNEHFIKKLFKKHFKSTSLKRSNSKLRKSDIFIVRDVGDTLFKTNSTFDMTEMSRMHHNFLRNTGTDDDSNNHNQHHQQEREGRIYENLPFFGVVDASVSSWMESIKKSTETYDDDVIYNVKTIPSRSFGEGEWKWRPPERNEQEQEVQVPVERFVETYKGVFRIRDPRKDPSETGTVQICWCDSSESQSSVLPPLENNLLDKGYECNLTTTIMLHDTSHQDNDTLLSTISTATDIDSDSLPFDRALVRRTQTYMYLNKLLLSISLNTITLSYDRYLKKISLHYRLKITRKSADYYFCGSERNATLLLSEKSKKHFHHKYISKNESLTGYPATNEQNTRQEQYLRRHNYQTIFSRAITANATTTNMDEKPENTEVNNDIYYFIWNCDSASGKRTTVPASTHDPDDQNWVSAHDDFTSAADLMDVVDDAPRLFCDAKRSEMKSDSCSYTDVVILYNNIYPGDNQIIYKQQCNDPKEISVIKMPNSSEKTFKESRNGRFDVNSIVDSSVKEFLTTIRDLEDEDELTINQLGDTIHVTEATDDEMDGSNVSSKKSYQVSVRFQNEHVEKGDKEPEVQFIKKEKERHKVSRNEPLPKLRSTERAIRYKEARKSRRRSMGEDIQHTFQEHTQSNLRHAKSTSNLLETLNDEQAKSSSNLMSKLKKLFKKREVSLGPGPSENRIFGNSLEKLDMSTWFPFVPSFIVTCIETLEADDVITTHGLYRASGNKTTIDDIKKKIDESGSKSVKRYDCLKDQEANTLAGLLKQFFRELEPGIISHDIGKLCIENVSDIGHLRQLLNTLDDHQKGTLKYLIKHLTRVNQHSNDNLMDSNNLSIVWGPCLFKSLHTIDAIQSGLIVNINRVVKMMIDHYDEIFRK